MRLPYREILEIRSLRDDLLPKNIISNISYRIQSKSICRLLKKSKRYVNTVQKNDIYDFARFAININDGRLEITDNIDEYIIKFKKGREIVIVDTGSLGDDLIYITDKRDTRKDISFVVPKIVSSNDLGRFCYNIMVDIIIDYLRGR